MPSRLLIQADSCHRLSATTNVLLGVVPIFPADDTITTVGAVIVTPDAVVNAVLPPFVASAKYVPLALFGLATAGKQFNNVGLTIATLPL